MPRVERTTTPEAAPDDAPVVRGFWSGNLSFGLVNLPVSLVTAQRSGRVALRMLAPDGTPLRRRYFCPKDERALETDDIVRGYEVEKDRFVVVTDEELAALAPKLSQEIDLRRFVPLAEIDPMYFERGYYLIPGKGAIKAYRLLAHVMEERNRAGIATFVMRGKEYLVAIIAREGILRAETLRFVDELRDAPEIGMTNSRKPADAEVREFERSIAKLESKALELKELEDVHTTRLLELIERKRRAGKDVIANREEESDEEAGSADVVDLMKYLKESLAGGGVEHARSRDRRRPRAASRRADKPSERTPRKRAPRRTATR